MRCITKFAVLGIALFISFSGLCLLHAPADEQDFHHKNDLFLPETVRKCKVQTGCKLHEGWSKVLDFTGEIGFC